MSTVFDAELIKTMSWFEAKTRARCKDCFTDQNGKLTFILEQGELGKAIGKKAAKLRELEEKLGKKIRVAEFAPNVGELIVNLTTPLKIVDLEEREDGVIIIQGKDMKTNGLLIGKQARNLRNLEWMVRRFYDVKEIKVA